MAEIINIVGDSHDFVGLKNILDKFDNIISLGDAIHAAANKEVAKKEHYELYRKCFRAFTKKDFSSITSEDKEWFTRVNIEGWKNQLETIKNSGKNITISMGNSEFSMLSLFPECKTSLEKALKENSKFKFISKPEIKIIKNIQLLFLPFSNMGYKLDEILNKIDNNKQLFVLTHCPAFKQAKKEYYVDCYNTIKLISEKYKGKIYYIHGHIHSSESYEYSRNGLGNVSFLTPKAEDNREGFGVNHHAIQINCEDASIKLFDSISGKFVSFKELPKKHISNEEHWNEFEV